MKLLPVLLAAGLVACSTAPADNSAVQKAASLMVSIGQHGEGMSTADIADLSGELDQHVAASPDDPYVLKLAAQSRRALSDLSQDREQRVALRHAALAELDKAIKLAARTTASRVVTLNGQETEIDLKDLRDLRAQLSHQVQTDR